jgi:hypothetical protein
MRHPPYAQYDNSGHLTVESQMLRLWAFDRSPYYGRGALKFFSGLPELCEDSASHELFRLIKTLTMHFGNPNYRVSYPFSTRFN